MTKIGVGRDQDDSELRAIASAGHSHTGLVKSNWTLLTGQLADTLTDMSCNSKREIFHCGYSTRSPYSGFNTGHVT